MQSVLYLKMLLDKLVEPLSPRVKLVEGPAREVWHEDRIRGKMDKGLAGGGAESCLYIHIHEGAWFFNK